jgi:hypothetical protein
MLVSASADALQLLQLILDSPSHVEMSVADQLQGGPGDIAEGRTTENSLTVRIRDPGCSIHGGICGQCEREGTSTH